MKKSFSTPILLLIFNRPDATLRLIEHLRTIRPTTLYVGADGPRATKVGEAEKCAHTRSIMDQIDWPCTIERRFRKTNLGCRAAVFDAITWFFDQEESGIILEDDCLPESSFFYYCQTLLAYYKQVPEVMHIGGDNPIGDFFPQGKESYHFVQMPLVWGWATWREAWQKMNLELTGLASFEFDTLSYDRLSKKYLKEKLWSTQIGKNDSWAYAWYFSILQQNGICTLPKNNLVRNIGFGTDSTHTKKASKIREIKSQGMIFPLVHPPKKTNQKLDQALFFAAQKSKIGLLGRFYLPTWLRKILGANQ